MSGYNWSEQFLHSILIGFGALGSNVYTILQNRGFLFSHVITPHLQGNPMQDNETTFHTSIRELDPSYHPNLIMISVPDQQIPGVAELLAAHFRNLGQTLIFHTSGTLRLDALLPLQEKGAWIGSWHPMMTFIRQSTVPSLKGVLMALDGDPYALPILRDFCHLLEGTAVTVPPEFRPLYHLLGVFSANFMISHLHIIHDLLQELRSRTKVEIQPESLLPLIEQTVRNYFQWLDPARALSGPVPRRDFATIEAHLKSLLTVAPQLLPIYRWHTLHLARSISYSQEEMAKLQNILDQYHERII